jgi:hypothetical protein
MYTSPAGGGGSGHFQVSPAELHSAAGTLRGVHGELGGFAHSCADLGSSGLDAAVNDFFKDATALAANLEMTVVAAAGEVDTAGTSYTETDRKLMLPEP